MQPKISLSQALLLCLEKAYEDDDEDTYEYYASIYLQGISYPQMLSQKILSYLGDIPYTIAYDHQTVNNDPTRRFFETTFAYQTLKYSSHYLQLRTLIRHRNYLLAILNENLYLEEMDAVETIVAVAKGVLGISFLHGLKEEVRFDKNVVLECRSMFEAIRDNFSRCGLFSSNTLEKLDIITEIFLYTMIWAKSLQDLALTPLRDLYREGYYRKKNRGRIDLKKSDKENFTPVNVANYGIMKLHMPQPYHNNGFISDSVTPWQRPGDKCTYVPNSPWAEHNFSFHLHPFVSSISGMMLMQLKCLAAFKLGFRNIYSDIELLLFMRAFAVLLLFKSGGHSLYEFFAPMSIRKVRAYLGETFPFFRELSFHDFTGFANEDIVVNSITKAVIYNGQLLKRYDMHNQLLQQQKRVGG